MYITVFCTTKDKSEAEFLAKEIIQLKLAACVNIIDSIQSVYVWDDKLCNEAEALMIIKTTKEHFEELEKSIKTRHSYDNPEIISLPIEKGSAEYLSWIDQSTS